MAAEATITATPVQAAAPPRPSRTAAVSSTATSVGTKPKYNPVTASSTDRVSNTMPGTSWNGTSMTPAPSAPSSTPRTACCQ